MASLTAAPATFAAFGDYVPMPMGCDAADTFYRGALVFYLGGQVVPLTVADSELAGVVAEHTVTLAADEPVLVYPASVGGLFLFANTAFTIAASGSLFYQLAAGHDDPGTLTATATGNSASVGRLVVSKTSATDGWLSIGDRSDPAT